MILGVMKTPVAYEEGVISLKGGDMLVLFTDGISEAMNAQQQEYGEERLERVLHRVHGEDAPSVVRAIHDDVALHTSGAPQSDDITMMVVKIR
jgi:sigma-B regulation protein RsbU (phosphoserine phosphatase)